jgi:hypothetical protein
MSHIIIKEVIIGGVQNLRNEIGKLHEILRNKHKRFHEMESLLTLIQGRPSSVSYESDELIKSIPPVATVDVGTQTEILPPMVKIDIASNSDNDSAKLNDGDVLKIFYKGKVVGVGIFHCNPKAKSEYYVFDTKTKKHWPVMSKWSLARKQEVNPDLKVDNAKKSVNCWRRGKWIKLEDIAKA